MTVNTQTGRFTFLVSSAVAFVAVLMGVLLLSTGIAHAQSERAANVQFATGYVAATAPGASARELAKGDGVYSADRVDTAENGRVQMRFTDGGLVSLMPNTTFSVDEYLYDGQADADSSLVFGLLKGGLRTVTGAIGQVQHDQYELKTPVATLGIRGTEYVAVLRPANTLRVHVGRGKVVITNDQGSLEVPEGRNAVVTLGSAPEFSERGPQYQATAPMGDRLTPTSQHRQDPHLLDPRANMPDLDENSFVGLPVNQGTPPTSTPTPTPTPAPTPTPTPTPAPTPTPTPTPEPPPPTPQPPVPEPEPPTPPPPTPEPPVSPPPAPTPTPQPPPPVTPTPDPDPDPGPSPFVMAMTLPQFSGGMFNVSPDDVVSGTWTSYDVGTSGAISWGRYTDGTGTVSGVEVPLILDTLQNQYESLAYVIADTPVVTLPPGMLNYSLEAGTTARGTWGDIGTLDTFDLGIDLGTQDYTLDFSVSMDIMGEYSANNMAGSLSTATPEGFSFSDTMQGTSACGSSGCQLDVGGFLAGSNAEQAGIVYRIMGNDDIVTGAASLTKQP